MKSAFFDRPFDHGTRIKLEIFRRYVREWIPVFLTRSPNTSWCRQINIFDLFCGPGQDSEGTPGSPLIIQQEIKLYCQKNRELKKDIPVNLFLSDDKAGLVEILKERIYVNRCQESCCNFFYDTAEFGEVVEKFTPYINDPASANLIFLDQFGVKEISPLLISTLLQAKATDILFFISTSAIRRFSEEPGFKEMFPGEDIKSVEYKVVHRYLTEWFQKETRLKQAYFAPFSIKKGSNIYGLIFATMNELGIEKFLRVCWDLDPTSGQANYNIDGDLAWGGQSALFPEMNIPTKKQVFEHGLIEYISHTAPTNQEVYRFALQRGFPARECTEILKGMQKAGKIKTELLEDGATPRRGAFYLKEKSDKIRVVKG